jgi:hypothetical protein
VERLFKRLEPYGEVDEIAMEAARVLARRLENASGRDARRLWRGT